MKATTTTREPCVKTTEQTVYIDKDEQYWWYGGTTGTLGGDNGYHPRRTGFSKITISPNSKPKSL